MNRLLGTLVFSLAVVFSAGVDAKQRIDELPMYGGFDRSTKGKLIKADEKLISGTKEQFGSREKASIAFVNTAFRYYQQGKNKKAMRRFNQAWLLNPDNPEVYWGFASLLHDSGDYCEGFRLLELGVSKGKLQGGYKPDLAVLYAACAFHDAQISSEQKIEYSKKSNKIFSEAETDIEVPKPYLYFQWARSLIAQEKYEMAWKAVKQYRSITSDPFDSTLLKRLKKNLPEPQS